MEVINLLQSLIFAKNYLKILSLTIQNLSLDLNTQKVYLENNLFRVRQFTIDILVQIKSLTSMEFGQIITLHYQDISNILNILSQVMLNFEMIQYPQNNSQGEMIQHFFDITADIQSLYNRIMETNLHFYKAYLWEFGVIFGFIIISIFLLIAFRSFLYFRLLREHDNNLQFILIQMKKKSEQVMELRSKFVESVHDIYNEKFLCTESNLKQCASQQASTIRHKKHFLVQI